MSYIDEQVRQFALFRIAKIFNVSVDSLRMESSFGDDLKASSVSGWFKKNEHDQIEADIYDVADRQAYKEITSGRLMVRTVGEYCDHMVRSYKTKSEDVKHVLKMSNCSAAG